MRYFVDITEITFLSKSMVLLKMERRWEKPLNGTCEIPWVVRMCHWLSDSQMGPPRKGQDPSGRIAYIPAVVDMTPGMVVEGLDLLLEEKSPGRDVLTAWTVMES